MREGTESPAPSGSVAVLLYHEVTDEPVTRGFKRYTVAPSQLEEHLSALSSAGYATGTMAGLASLEGSSDRPRVVLTFDDAFASFSTTVLPLLATLGMQATLYVPTAFVGGRAEWLRPVGEADRRLLSWDDLADARDAGVELGGNGHRHLELDAIAPHELDKEMALSRELLEAKLGISVGTFAYPFGYHDRATRRAALRCGYQTACEVGYGLHRLRSDPFSVRRLLVNGGIDAEQLLASVASGRSTPVERLRRASRPAWRAYRRMRGGGTS